MHEIALVIGIYAIATYVVAFFGLLPNFPAGFKTAIFAVTYILATILTLIVLL